MCPFGSDLNKNVNQKMQASTGQQASKNDEKAFSFCGAYRDFEENSSVVVSEEK